MSDVKIQSRRGNFAVDGGGNVYFKDDPKGCYREFDVGSHDSCAYVCVMFDDEELTEYGAEITAKIESLAAPAAGNGDAVALLDLTYRENEMGTIVGGSVAVVKSKHGIEVTTYKSELDAVLGMIDNGSLGGGTGYGCEDHVVALAFVDNRIQEIRKLITEQSERELSGCSDSEV